MCKPAYSSYIAFAQKCNATVYYVNSVPISRHYCSIKGITHGGSISILTYESYHYALSRKRAQVARVLHCTRAMYLGPFDEYMMYTDIDCVPTHTFELHFI